MAEIVISHVLGRSEPSGRQFFCHGCQKKFTHRLPDPSSSMVSEETEGEGEGEYSEAWGQIMRVFGGSSLYSTVDNLWDWLSDSLTIISLSPLP